MFEHAILKLHIQIKRTISLIIDQMFSKCDGSLFFACITTTSLCYHTFFNAKNNFSANNLLVAGFEKSISFFHTILESLRKRVQNTPTSSLTVFSLICDLRKYFAKLECTQTVSYFCMVSLRFFEQTL